MALLPDFRKIYRDARTDEEELVLKSRATNIAILFTAIAVIALTIQSFFPSHRL
jgi:hypothetical protein